MAGAVNWVLIMEEPEIIEKECPICTALMDWVDDHDGISPCGDWVCPECERQSKELKQSDNVSRWVSVKEQLPKAGDYVVAALESGLFLVSLIRKDTGRWATAATVTHWMRIPALTQEEVQP